MDINGKKNISTYVVNLLYNLLLSPTILCNFCLWNCLKNISKMHVLDFEDKVILNFVFNYYDEWRTILYQFESLMRFKCDYETSGVHVFACTYLF